MNYLQGPMKHRFYERKRVAYWVGQKVENMFPRPNETFEHRFHDHAHVSILDGHKAEYEVARPRDDQKLSFSRTRLSLILRRPEVTLSSQVKTTPGNIVFSTSKGRFLVLPEGA